MDASEMCLSLVGERAVNGASKSISNGVCSCCRAIRRKLRVFRLRSVKAAQFLGCPLSEHQHETWDDYLRALGQADLMSNFDKKCLNYSNTLCISVSPGSDGSDIFQTQVSSYLGRSGTPAHTNYCQNMEAMSAGEVDKILICGNTHLNGFSSRDSDHSEAKIYLEERDYVEESESVADIKDSKEGHCLDPENEVMKKKSKSSLNKKKVKIKTGEEKLSLGRDFESEFETMFVCRTNLSVEEQKEALEKQKFSEAYLSSPYKCVRCFIGFQFQYSLDNHMKKHSKESGPIVCIVCTQRFTTHNKHREHVRLHHKQMVECVVCRKRIKERKRLREHWEMHLGMTFTCDVCQRGFKTKSCLTRHIASHNTSYPCPHCQLVLKSRPTYKKHLLLHSSEHPHACHSCPRTFATREWLELHLQRAHVPVTEQFYCVECDRKFKSSREYKKHLSAKKHTDPSLLCHTCSKCPRRYATQEDLARHVSALHDRVLKFSCPVCPAQFATTRGLYGHKRRVHMGYVAPKKYSCSFCGKAFRDKYYLSTHLRVHTGIPHKCQFCLSTFSHTLALIQHMKHDHGEGT